MAPQILLFCIGVQCWAASFCLTAIPQSPKETGLSLGKGIYVWELVIAHSTGPVSRPDIVERLPFSIMFQKDAEDNLDRKASSDKRTIFAAYYGSIKDVGPTGLAYAATRVSNPMAKGLMLVLAGIWALSQGRVASRVPNTASTKAQLLPDAGTGGDWDGKVITGLRHGAEKVGPLCSAPLVAWEDTPELRAFRLARILTAHQEMLGAQ